MQLRRGDTLIEVTLAVAIFALVAAVSIGLMNMGLNTAEAGLEATMARNEMDAQAEALRFIHHSFMSERELADSEQQYTNVWKALTNESDGVGINAGRANRPSEELSKFAYDSCDEVYNSDYLTRIHAFAINTRSLNSGNVSSSTNRDNVIVTKLNSNFSPTQVYPRIIYSNSSNSSNSDQNLYDGNDRQIRARRVEGLWVYVVRDFTTGNLNDIPQFYDFHIRACWYGPGHTHPTTLATIIRLYNPEYVEGTRK